MFGVASWLIIQCLGLLHGLSVFGVASWLISVWGCFMAYQCLGLLHGLSVFGVASWLISVWGCFKGFRLMLKRAYMIIILTPCQQLWSHQGGEKNTHTHDRITGKSDSLFFTQVALRRKRTGGNKSICSVAHTLTPPPPTTPQKKIQKERKTCFGFCNKRCYGSSIGQGYS